MKNSLKDFIDAKAENPEISAQFAKYQKMESDELTKMFFDLAKKEKANGRGDEMFKMIDNLRPMLSKEQQKNLELLLKTLK